MSMHRVVVLEVETSELPVQQCGLWMRDGLDGVEVWIEDKRISIPRAALVQLIVHEYRWKQISRLEQMTDAEIMSTIMQERTQ